MLYCKMQVILTGWSPTALDTHLFWCRILDAPWKEEGERASPKNEKEQIGNTRERKSHEHGGEFCLRQSYEAKHVFCLVAPNLL